MEDFKTKKYYWIRITLFVLTVVTTTLAGAEWINGSTFMPIIPDPMGWEEFLSGFRFSIPFLLILTAHEFGHYFTAIKNNVSVTLPAYLPFWLGFVFGLPSIGTFGAFIQLRSKNISKVQHFDIGIAGPLAGFVVAIVVLLIGYTNLPPKESVFDIHPEYEYFGSEFENYVYTTDSIVHNDAFKAVTGKELKYDSAVFDTSYPKLAMGKNLIMVFMEAYVVQDKSRIPNDFEIFHNPWLFAGYLALLFTALNLLPIGQLDGGHILYGLVGHTWHKRVASVLFVGFVFYAGMGVVSLALPFDSFLLYSAIYIWLLKVIFNGLKIGQKDTWLVAVSVYAVQFGFGYFMGPIEGYSGWLLFAFIIGKFIGVEHPKGNKAKTVRVLTEDGVVLVEEKEKEEPALDLNRKILGWLALVILILCFTPAPLSYI